MATTHTYTSTFVRLDLIKMQVRVMLRRTTMISQSSLSFLERLLDKKCVSTVSVYGLDRHNLCRVQLSLEIDWREYNFQITHGRAKVSIDERWKDNTAIEVDEAINLFNDFVSTKSLSTQWGYSLCSWADTTEQRRALGIPLGNAEPVKWTPSNNWSSTIPELQEVRVGLRFGE